ncbi:MAG: hypothetical protein K1X63_13520 [Chitinophagales bacterium]|nr:hypothetical protein [Chitinophagales bacterium]
MKHLILLCCIVGASITSSFSQEIIKGIPVTISLIPKSAKQPSLKLKDGAGISLKYNAADGIHVLLSKNGKTSDFCDPFSNTQLVQVGETDIEKDGKTEVVVASRSSESSIEILIFKKAEFEVYYKEWSSFTGVSAVEFEGDGTVKMYEPSGKFGTFKIGADGKVAGLE